MIDALRLFLFHRDPVHAFDSLFNFKNKCDAIHRLLSILYIINTSREKLGYLTQSVFLLHPTRVITGTTTGKLVLWDYKPNGNPVSQRPAKLIIDQKELTMDKRELTRDTFKSSTSTRSGTLSSRKSSGKSEENNPRSINPVAGT